MHVVGGLGLAAIQIAQTAGATAVGTAGSTQKRGYLRELGVHAAMDSRSTDFATTLAAAKFIEKPTTILNSLTSPGKYCVMHPVKTCSQFLQFAFHGLDRGNNTHNLLEPHKQLFHQAFDVLVDATELQALADLHFGLSKQQSLHGCE